MFHISLFGQNLVLWLHPGAGQVGAIDPQDCQATDSRQAKGAATHLSNQWDVSTHLVPRCVRVTKRSLYSYLVVTPK